ncbi:hypothetical protein MG290_05825 [Flavobacterium sp. CBA20B-1]|uniref:hypothetical protein n=1 Tax=unclassified Flavobacterium TaxID=196869 RepID=UPI0022242AC8|nr:MULTISPECIES: hypothetical protein [unclassified Flavobacterium]WCM43176.1 hypothetical protein MG290_05825 [Flavobacterium sp. CBA20B-1]
MTVFETNEKDKATELNETKIYKLKKQTTNSDFNYSKLNGIDGHKMDTLNIRNIITVFEPVRGEFNYYQFLATFKGEGYNSGEAPIIKDFHDILIIKTDSDNNILDSYHYTLEWAEIPLQYDVFKGSSKNLKLTDSLQISKLKLIRTYSWSEDNKELMDNGIIRLK